MWHHGGQNFGFQAFWEPTKFTLQDLLLSRIISLESVILHSLHFVMFSFFQVSLLLHVFIIDCFCVVIASATDLRERFLLSGVFYLTLLYVFVKAFLLFSLEGYRASHWGLKHRPSPSVCLNHTVFASYMISMELYLNLSKFVDKLLVGKSLIHFKHFS